MLSGDQPVHLRPQSYEVLKYLAENRGRLICKDTLIEKIWQGRAVTDDALVQCLIEVRHALGVDGKHYVRNVRGRGYIFESDDAESGSDNGLEAVFWKPDRSSETDSQAGATHVLNGFDSSKLPALLGSLAVVIVALGAAAYLRYSRPAPPEIASIAVLPFSNDTGDQTLEYFSDGLSETLIDRLAQFPSLKVVARTSSFKYKGKEINPSEVGASLGVQAIVTGRVVQRGDELRVRVELVNAREGTQIWGAQYSRRATDVQSVQDEIARAISEKLELRLNGQEKQQLAKHATDNSQAYQLYLSGLFYRRQGGFENSKKALDYFNRALALDPEFALTWTGVAEVNGFLAHDGYVDPKPALAKSKAAAQKALELDETLAESHLVLAEIKKEEWDWAGAEREFKRALELNPNLADAHHWYSRYLSSMGRHEEAVIEIERAQELDPLRPRLRFGASLILYAARRFDEAIQQVQQGMQMEPKAAAGPLNLGLIYEAQGLYGQAIKEYQRAISLSGDTAWRQIILGYALARSDRRGEAQAILNKLKTTRDDVSPAELATLYIGLGDHEGAIASLERAYREHDLQLQYLKTAPHYDPLRSDPRFQDLLRRIGLAT